MRPSNVVFRFILGIGMLIAFLLILGLFLQILPGNEDTQDDQLQTQRKLQFVPEPEPER